MLMVDHQQIFLKLLHQYRASVVREVEERSNELAMVGPDPPWHTHTQQKSNYVFIDGFSLCLLHADWINEFTRVKHLILGPTTGTQWLFIDVNSWFYFTTNRESSSSFKSRRAMVEPSQWPLFQVSTHSPSVCIQSGQDRCSVHWQKYQVGGFGLFMRSCTNNMHTRVLLDSKTSFTQYILTEGCDFLYYK